MKMTVLRRPVPAAALLPILLGVAVAGAGCDIVTADLKHSQSAEWRRTYELQPGGRVEINNVNGKIEVAPSDGNTVEVVAKKTAKGTSPEAAKEALDRIEILDSSSPSGVRVDTRIGRNAGWLHSGGASVAYAIRVPANTEVKFATVNGGVELRGISGTIVAQTTNGGVTARDVSGSIDASTTNGGIDIDMAELGERGATLECTNGGLKLRLPADAKATISASVTNGGIDTSGLSLETRESTRRRLEARLNGGGAPVRIEGTNGGIRIAAR